MNQYFCYSSNLGIHFYVALWLQMYLETLLLELYCFIMTRYGVKVSDMNILRNLKNMHDNSKTRTMFIVA
jgi:hypothetical protein